MKGSVNERRQFPYRPTRVESGGRTAVVGGGGDEEVLQRKGEEKRTRQHNQNIQGETGGTRNAIESMQPRG